MAAHLQRRDAIKRIVVTSFVGTVQEPKSEPHTYTEARLLSFFYQCFAIDTLQQSEWNETVPDLVELSGRTAPNFLKFVASKVLQEQYVWEFIQSKSEVNFDVVTLLPSFLLGVCRCDLRVYSY